MLVVNEYNEITLLRQGYLSDRYESFVAGYIKPGESAEDTAIREVKEEIGIVLESLEPAGTVWFEPQQLLMHAFVGRAKKQELCTSSEVDKAQWVPAPECASRIFPDSPGNAECMLYRKYMEGKFKK